MNILCGWAGFLFGFSSAFAGERGFFRETGLDREEFHTVRIFSAIPQIGDYLMFTAPLLDGFHRLYPKAMVEAPMAVRGIFGETDFFHPCPLDINFLADGKFFRELQNFEPQSPDSEVAKFFQSYLGLLQPPGPSELFVYDSRSLRLLLRRLGNLWRPGYDPMHDLRIQSAVRRMNGAILAKLRRGKGHVFWYDTSAQPKVFTQGRVVDGAAWHANVGTDFGRWESTYQNTRELMKNLFGKTASAWTPMAYLSPPAERKFLPNERFVLANLNVGDPGKSIPAALESFAVLRAIVALVNEEFPGVRIVLTPQETIPQLSRWQKWKTERQWRATQALITQKGIVLLPNDKRQWTAAMLAAMAVVSRDGGFVHLAMQYRQGAESVVSFSAFGDELRFFTAPEQPIAFNYTGRLPAAYLRSALRQAKLSALHCEGKLSNQTDR